MQLKIPSVIGVAASASLSETLTTHFATNMIYRLSFYLDPGTSLSVFNGITVKLTSNGTSIDSLSGVALTGLLSANSFSQETIVYTNTSNSGDIGIDLSLSSLVGVNENVLVDDFALTDTPLSTTPTPEPSFFVLSSLGCFISCGLKRFFPLT